MATRKKDFNYYVGKRYDNMMGRCYRESDTSYKNYGARGIKVCSEWIKDINSFRIWFISELVKNKIELENFLANSKSFQLDRIDVDKHYTPANCRIVSPQGNARNKRVSNKKVLISAEGEKIYI